MATVISINDIQLGDIVSFVMYGNTGFPDVKDGEIVGTILGTSVTNPSKAATIHANIYPTIPTSANVPNDPTAYKYFVVKKTDGTTVEVGLAWIAPLSVERLLRKTAVITITDYDNSRTAELKNILRLNGFIRNTITVR